MKLNGEALSKNKFIGLIKFLLLQTYLIKRSQTIKFYIYEKLPLSSDYYCSDFIVQH